jgi:branched-chain amino acid transport system substrate-binding protein
MARSRSRWWSASVAGVSLVVVIAAGCSSSSKSGTSNTGSGNNSTPTTVNDAAVLGTPKAATGAPLTIGFVSDGKSESIDNSAETPGGQAAAKYVNAYLGGVDGRPIQLDTCDTNQTPSGAQDCVTKFINDKVPVVVNGVSGQGGTLMDGLSKANIPFVEFGGLDQKILLSPDAAMLTNGVASGIAGAVVIGQQEGHKKAALVVIDVPAAVGPIASIAPTFYKNGGMDVQIVKVAPNVADMTPQIQSAISAGAQQFALVGNASFCQSALQAMQTLNYTGTKVLISPCLNPDVIKAVDVTGDKLVTTSSDNDSDKEVALYNAVMAKYAPGASTDPIAAGGYGVVLGTVRALAGLTGEVTPKTVLAAINSMKPAQLPLAPEGVTFQCGAKAVPIAPAICSKGALVTTLKKDGTGDTYQPIDTTAIVKLG